MKKKNLYLLLGIIFVIIGININEYAVYSTTFTFVGLYLIIKRIKETSE